MAINRIDLQQVSMVRTGDYSSVKQNEDNKGLVDQTNFQTEFAKEAEHKMIQLQGTQETTQQEFKFDAREKGSNEYINNRKKKREKRDESAGLLDKDGRKVDPGATSSFDIKL